MAHPGHLLPDDWLPYIQRESVPSPVAALCRRLPITLEVRVCLAGGSDLPPPWVRRLIKLCSQSAALSLGGWSEGSEDSVELRRAEPSAAVASPGSQCGSVTLSAASGDDLEAGLRHALARLLSSAELTDMLTEMADKEVMLASLQEITRSMLAKTDVERALYIMLSGITSGQGLGFNRAAIFAYDAARQEFTGSKAIGPYDEAEAHRIWEDIERQGKTIQSLVDDYAKQNFDSRLSQFVRTLRLDLGQTEELAQLSSDSEPLLLDPSPHMHPAFRALGVRGPYVLAGIFARGRLLGLAFADNRFSDRPIGPDQRSSFGFYIAQTALVWEHLELLARIEALALSDPLTGLSNRRAFETELAAAIASSEEGGTPCSLWLLDVDHFKQHNDSDGHDAGDRILKELGSLLRETARSGELAARLGGDEFAVLLPSVGKSVARARALALGEAAESSGVHLSIGGASFPDDARSVVDLLKAADTQLYEAKRAGRGRVAFRGRAPEAYSPPGM